MEGKICCVWLGNQTNRSKDSQDLENDLVNIVHSFRYYNDFNRCVDFLLNNSNIIFIIEDIIAEKCLPIIHSFQQIVCIYIFTSNKKQWNKDYHKIQGSYNNGQLIAKNIEEYLHRSDQNCLPISFLSSSDIHSTDINRQDPLFMYFQLLKEILLNDDQDEIEKETKNDMLIFCRQIHAANPEILSLLDEFEEHFLPELAIYWYTRESFLYKMLNKALWTPEPDVLYKFRYFLRHLHQQIVTQSSLQRKGRTSTIVYRGQKMSTDEIEKLQDNVGGFLSFNNFLSTSLQRHVATNFLWGFDIGVLFEMKIDATIEKYPFANIEHLSFQQGNLGEREILFSTGTVFRIVEIVQSDHFYHVQLILSNDTDEQLSNYTKRTREQTRSTHSFLSLLKLMHELSQYNTIERFLKILDEDKSFLRNSSLLGSIHHAFGLIYHSRGETKQALDSFRKSLSLYLTILPADDPKLSPTYNNIGSVHLARSDYDTALTFSQLALDCQSNSKNPDKSAMITYTNNIAAIYNQQKKYNDALIYHKRALQLQTEVFGQNHLSERTTYNAIIAIYHKLNDYEQAAFYEEKVRLLQSNNEESDPEDTTNCSLRSGTLCLSQGEYDDALKHFNNALQIQEKYFLANNPSFATTYNRIAAVYYKQEQFDKSLTYYKKALEIEQNSLSNDHPSITASYSNICTAYVGLTRWSDALDYAFKAIEQSSKTDQNTRASLIHYIGYIYQEQHDYEKALIYYNEALDLFLSYLSSDDSSLIIKYYRIAGVYHKLKIYDKALSFYQKTLNIELKTLPDNAKTIAATYTNISTVYFSQKQFSQAFISANQGLTQLLKTLPKSNPEVVQQRAYLDAIKMSEILQNKESI